eukprot:GILJ01014448.1.p1 GENE.GILJ01014448.1~~GILJ01014448.1.p1  ORF type:complete len:471 (+),score=85.22 GILJ01014448.1:435-1847(+)
MEFWETKGYSKHKEEAAQILQEKQRARQEADIQQRLLADPTFKQSLYAFVGVDNEAPSPTVATVAPRYGTSPNRSLLNTKPETAKAPTSEAQAKSQLMPNNGARDVRSLQRLSAAQRLAVEERERLDRQKAQLDVNMARYVQGQTRYNGSTAVGDQSLRKQWERDQEFERASRDPAFLSNVEKFFASDPVPCYTPPARPVATLNRTDLDRPAPPLPLNLESRPVDRPDNRYDRWAVEPHADHLPLDRLSVQGNAPNSDRTTFEQRPFYPSSSAALRPGQNRAESDENRVAPVQAANLPLNRPAPYSATNGSKNMPVATASQNRAPESPVSPAKAGLQRDFNGRNGKSNVSDQAARLKEEDPQFQYDAHLFFGCDIPSGSTPGNVSPWMRSAGPDGSSRRADSTQKSTQSGRQFLGPVGSRDDSIRTSTQLGTPTAARPVQNLNQPSDQINYKYKFQKSSVVLGYDNIWNS